ncbi:MAG: ribulose-phosphate 3-epimerase [Planctomycetales bacterium]|nr:ribulose-phosphate 3-epimerase [Planctomycetales bacterium]
MSECVPKVCLPAELIAAGPAILPSLLLCDFANLGEEIARVEQAGAAALHLDVMDGHFVPNLSYGLPLVDACKKASRLPLDVHLMIANPEKYIEAYVEAGADMVTIHLEAAADPGPLLQRIRAAGAAAALAINPPTPVSALDPFLSGCDMVLVMSVMPGFGGQAFDPAALEKLRYLRDKTAGQLPLEVDGGIGPDTAERVAEAGAQLLVAGSAIFKQADYASSIQQLKQLATTN